MELLLSLRKRMRFLLLIVSMAAVSRPGPAQERAVLQNASGGGIAEAAGGVGDINGDGFDDIAFMIRQDYPYRDLVIALGRAGLTGTQALSPGFSGTVLFRVGEGTTHYAGDESIHGVGDINGDGFDDVLFSLPYAFGAGGDDVGKAYLLYGAADIGGEHFFDEVGDTLEGVVFASSDPSHDGIGRVVAGIGDVDGDGSVDLALSASKARNLQGEQVGMVFVLTDAANLPDEVDLATVGGEIPGMVVLGDPGGLGNIGYGVEGLGDFDGDGLGDLLLTTYQGAFIVHGRASLPALLDLSKPAENVKGILISEGPGLVTRAGGDLDRDGLADILLSVGEDSRGEVWTRIHVVHGRDDLPSSVQLDDPAGVEGVTVLDRPGVRMWASAADTNGDGLSDLLLTAPDSEVDGRSGAGEVFVVLGDAGAGLDWADVEGDFEGIRLVGDATSERFGRVAPAGDFDGDGAPDLLVRDSNRAFLFYGVGMGEPGPVIIGGRVCEHPRADRLPLSAEELEELDVTYRLEDATAHPGDTVGITFTVQSDRSIEGLSFSIDFDESILELSSAERLWTRADGEPFPVDLIAVNNDDTIPGDSGLAEGHVTGAMVADLHCDDFNLPADTVFSIVELNFTLSPQADPGSTEIRIVDGALAPSGLPVRNGVTVEATTVYPDLATSFVFVDATLNIVPGVTTFNKFIRGDANGDRLVDMSDALSILSHLFLGAYRIRCLDAGDVNDDGTLDISDAITLLEHLFLDSRPIPAPGADAPDEDPTEDALDCVRGTHE